MLRKLNEQLRHWLKKRHVKSFYISCANTSFRSGTQALIQSTGLGKLRPNVLALGFKQDWQMKGLAGLPSLEEYFGIIQDAFDAHLGVMILRTNAGGLDFSDMIKTHNLGDTSRLKLPELQPGLRPNASERSLPGAAAALQIQNNNASAEHVLLPQNSLQADSSQVINELKDSASKDMSSTNSSLKEGQHQPDEDYESCSENEYEDVDEEYDEYSDDQSLAKSKSNQTDSEDLARLEEGKGDFVTETKKGVNFENLDGDVPLEEKKKLLHRRRK